jgi:hypothetical protein
MRAREDDADYGILKQLPDRYLCNFFEVLLG